MRAGEGIVLPFANSTTCTKTACTPLLSTSPAASDVTQQVFLKLLTNISQYRGEAVFSTWLYLLVVNACLDEARIGKPRAGLWPIRC